MALDEAPGLSLVANRLPGYKKQRSEAAVAHASKRSMTPIQMQVKSINQFAERREGGRKPIMSGQSAGETVWQMNAMRPASIPLSDHSRYVRSDITQPGARLKVKPCTCTESVNFLGFEVFLAPPTAWAARNQPRTPKN